MLIWVHDTRRSGNVKFRVCNSQVQGECVAPRSPVLSASRAQQRPRLLCSGSKVLPVKVLVLATLTGGEFLSCVLCSVCSLNSIVSRFFYCREVVLLGIWYGPGWSRAWKRSKYVGGLPSSGL